MKDYAEAARKAKLREWSEWVDGIEDRLAQAKERLGDKWLLSPNYNGHYVPELTKKVN